MKYAIAILRKFWNATEKHNVMPDKMEKYLFGGVWKILYRYQFSSNYSIIVIRSQQKY